MSWFVYIAQAESGNYYTGITTDPSRRLKKHNSGNGAQMFFEKGIFTLRYVSSAYQNKSEARKRELQIKKWSRNKKQKLIQGVWF